MKDIDGEIRRAEQMRSIAPHPLTDAPGFGGGQGREPKDTEDTGNALVGCCGWFLALLVASLLIWGAVRALREAPPRHPPFSELPMDPKGGGR